MTFSVWKDDAAMMDAAYRTGTHRAQIDRYKAEKTADRTSFTRARLLASAGAAGSLSRPPPPWRTA